ncbi:MAG TPA: hypothetical protein VFO27_02635 [Bryobacteraceae bacterium]|nr:hypothetical protein [Bryobacteraceae bacterium]
MPPPPNTQRNRASIGLELHSATEKAWEEVTAACQAYEQRLREFQQLPGADLFEFMQGVARKRDAAVDKYRDTAIALIDFLREAGRPAASGTD